MSSYFPYTFILSYVVDMHIIIVLSTQQPCVWRQSQLEMTVKQLKTEATTVTSKGALTTHECYDSTTLTTTTSSPDLRSCFV